MKPPQAKDSKRYRTSPSALSLALVPLLLAALTSTPSFGGLQDDLNDRWRGTWVVAKSELASDCDGSFSNHRAGEARSGRVQLPEGELARVGKVDVKRSRVDVFLELEEPVLLRFRDGPFELFQEAQCKVELLVELPDRSKALGIEGVESEMRLYLDRHRSLEDARASTRWNERERRSFPPDYEDTLAEYRAWRIDQHNRAIEARVRESQRQAARMLAYAREVESSGARYQEEFKNGFFRGMTLMTATLRGDCGSLMQSNVSTFARRVDGANRPWQEGFAAGQRLGYHVGLAAALESCKADEVEPPVTFDDLQD